MVMMTAAALAVLARAAAAPEACGEARLPVYIYEHESPSGNAGLAHAVARLRGGLVPSAVVVAEPERACS